MLVTMTTQKKILFYESGDLKEWTKTGEFSTQSRLSDDEESELWGPADMFPLYDEQSKKFRWVLILNLEPGYQVGSGTRYFLGQYDGSKFVLDYDEDITQARYIDYGADFTGLHTLFDFPLSPQYRTGFGWMGNLRYQSKTPTAEWKGSLAFPRNYFLKWFNDRLWVVSQPNLDYALKPLFSNEAYIYD
jgi:fructan beta-fructosidase